MNYVERSLGAGKEIVCDGHIHWIVYARVRFVLWQAYTENPDALAAAVIRQGWFTADELERL